MRRLYLETGILRLKFLQLARSMLSGYIKAEEYSMVSKRNGHTIVSTLNYQLKDKNRKHVFCTSTLEPQQSKTE